MTITDLGPIGPALSLLAVAGVVISYLLLRREMRAELAKLRTMVKEVPAAEPNSVPLVAQPESKPIASVAESAAAPKKPKQESVSAPVPAKEEVTPEILAVIAAAVAQFLGAGARIRSTRLLATPGGMNPWAQQGRVIIQASHNLGVR